MRVEPGQASAIKDHYSANGYYLAPAVYPEDRLVQMESEFDRAVGQLRNSGEHINARWDGPNMDELDDSGSEIIHTHNVHRYSARWLEAFQYPAFLDVAEQLIGPDIIMHHNKLFQKPARQGSAFPVHQDWWYFPTRHDTMIAAVIFLGDADDSCGGFRIYPGSHKLGRQENTSGLTQSDILKNYPLEKATPISAKRGDVLFFSYFTLHGSLPNRSERVRKTVLLQLYNGNDYLLPNEEVNHVNEALVLRGWNFHMTRDKASH